MSLKNVNKSALKSTAPLSIGIERALRVCISEIRHRISRARLPLAPWRSTRQPYIASHPPHAQPMRALVPELATVNTACSLACACARS